MLSSSQRGSSKVNTLTVETFAVAKVSYVGKDYINLTDSILLLQLCSDHYFRREVRFC